MNRTVIVNGGSRGIGAAIVRMFAEAGDAVYFTYRVSDTAATTLAKETGAVACRADSRDHTQVTAVVRDVLAARGRVDVLVNCAARSEFALFCDQTDEAWHDTMACNLDGYYYYCKDVLPSMIRQKSGRIINIASMWGQVGASCEVSYSVSKAAVIGLTRALAKEMGPSGITVNCVSPGVIDTEMNAALSASDMEALREETPLERIGTPEDVARSVLFLAGEGGVFYTGQILAPNGGFIIG